jgi:hypothetical protein
VIGPGRSAADRGNGAGHHLLAPTPGASLEEIAAARRAIAAAAVELTRLVDAMRLFEAKHATVPYFGRS